MSTTNKRMRTQDQLERKRAADILNHKVRRAKDKNRLDQLEAEVKRLRSEVDDLTAKLQISQEEVARCAKCSKAEQDRLSHSSATNHGQVPDQPDVSSLLAHYSDSRCGNNIPTAWMVSSEAPIEVDFRSMGTASSISAVVDDRIRVSPTVVDSRQMPVLCICGVRHGKSTDCLEYTSYDMLLRAHLSLLRGVSAFVHIPQSPSLLSLQLEVSDDDNPITKVLGHIFRHFEVSDMPTRFAVYILIYRLLRWRLYPNPQAYEDVPAWYRPSRAQETIPHNISIDYLPWPELRDFMVIHENVLYKEGHSVQMYMEGVRFVWPKSKELIVNCGRYGMSLNPDFQSSINQLWNWQMSQSWADNHSTLSCMVNVHNGS
ncbi:hypothetical protein BKA67DRAFT_576337 [Truncatella angustata]|uniref:BZIP transcription factor n=1 Tax=Truncatella angustata TaxID=152316 RepID=A0A9P8UFC0_9PEZI|nr:uncharacterized protein BKA67DRAFT_576337 [Truncatella angustata]KAH6648932.1 hypothetical protein BKA67DRAFT_576337 [Truncatella angustata]